MHIKIRGGTANDGEPSLCLTCRYATIVRGSSLRDEIIECAQLSYGRNRVTFPVTRCTEYSDRRQPALRLGAARRGQRATGPGHRVDGAAPPSRRAEGRREHGCDGEGERAKRDRANRLSH